MKFTLFVLDQLWIFKAILPFPSSVIYILLLLPTTAPQLTSYLDGPLEPVLHIGSPTRTFSGQYLPPKFPPLKDLTFPEFCLHYTCWKPAKYPTSNFRDSSNGKMIHKKQVYMLSAKFIQLLKPNGDQIWNLHPKT